MRTTPPPINVLSRPPPPRPTPGASSTSTPRANPLHGTWSTCSKMTNRSRARDGCCSSSSPSLWSLAWDGFAGAMEACRCPDRLSWGSRAGQRGPSIPPRMLRLGPRRLRLRKRPLRILRRLPPPQRVEKHSPLSYRLPKPALQRHRRIPLQRNQRGASISPQSPRRTRATKALLSSLPPTVQKQWRSRRPARAAIPRQRPPLWPNPLLASHHRLPHRRLPHLRLTQ